MTEALTMPIRQFTHARTKNGKSTTSPLYRKRRAALIKKLGGKCRICGTKKKLQFHHIRARKEGQMPGGWQMIYRIEKELEDGVEIALLCQTCHQEVHKGEPKECVPI